MPSKDEWISWMDGTDVLPPSELRRALDGDIPLLFRHLRHLVEVNGLDPIRAALANAQNALYVPPFIWYQAALEFPDLRESLNDAFLAAKRTIPPPSGKYFFLIDVSEEATKPVSDKNLISFIDVAAAAASMGKTDDTPVFAVSRFAQQLRPDVHGLALVDLAAANQPAAMDSMANALKIIGADFPDRTGLCFDRRDGNFQTAREIFTHGER